MQTCSICQEKLGFMNRFRYADGYICKQCYKKASRQFTETITNKRHDEIKELCAVEQKFQSDFEMTGRIGNYLLVDEKAKKICVLNNRLTKQQVSVPDFYNVEDIKKCEIICESDEALEELERKILRKEEGVVKGLKVRITFKDMRRPAEISFFDGVMRIKSYAFRQSFNFARRIVAELTRLQELCVE